MFQNKQVLKISHRLSRVDIWENKNFWNSTKFWRFEAFFSSCLNFEGSQFQEKCNFWICKNSEKNFDSGICMFDVVKCHLTIWTDLKREFLKSISDLSSLIAKEFSLPMLRLWLGLFMFKKCSKSMQPGHKSGYYLILLACQQFTWSPNSNFRSDLITL